MYSYVNYQVWALLSLWHISLRRRSSLMRTLARFCARIFITNHILMWLVMTSCGWIYHWKLSEGGTNSIVSGTRWKIFSRSAGEHWDGWLSAFQRKKLSKRTKKNLKQKQKKQKKRKPKKKVRVVTVLSCCLILSDSLGIKCELGLPTPGECPMNHSVSVSVSVSDNRYITSDGTLRF